MGARHHLDVRGREYGGAADPIELQNAKLLESDKPWSRERMLLVAERMRVRLKQLSTHLGGANWLDGRLQRGRPDDGACAPEAQAVGHVGAFSSLAAYVARAEARPAFHRAFAAQLAVFEGRKAVDGLIPQWLREDGRRRWARRARRGCPTGRRAGSGCRRGLRRSRCGSGRLPCEAGRRRPQGWACRAPSGSSLRARAAFRQA